VCDNYINYFATELNLGPTIVAPELNATERFEPTRVVTVIEWIAENRVSYNISVFPEVLITFMGEMTVHLIIPYNIQLTVNVSAIICRQERTTTEIIYYGELQYQVAIAFNILYCVMQYYDTYMIVSSPISA
jgi:hypothetical protein